MQALLPPGVLYRVGDHLGVCPKNDEARVERLARGPGAGGYDVLRLLEESPSCSLNIFEFLRVAQPRRPRYYSTSSSPRIHGKDVAHLTVGLQATPVPLTPGREFRGMSSHYMHTLREGDRLDIFLDSADGFHRQKDVTKPMIFVSVGTGFAPMRAFLWERPALKRAGVSLAEAALFNGIPFEQPRLYLPGRNRGVRGRRSAQSCSRGDVARAVGPPRLRPRPDPRAG